MAVGRPSLSSWGHLGHDDVMVAALTMGEPNDAVIGVGWELVVEHIDWGRGNLRSWVNSGGRWIKILESRLSTLVQLQAFWLNSRWHPICYCSVAYIVTRLDLYISSVCPKLLGPKQFPQHCQESRYHQIFTQGGYSVGGLIWMCREVAVLQQKQGKNAQVRLQVWAWAVQPVSTYCLLLLDFTLFYQHSVVLNLLPDPWSTLGSNGPSMTHLVP